MSARAVNEALGHLVTLGLLVEVGDEPRLVLNRDPCHVSPTDVIHGLRNEGQEIIARAEEPLTQRIRALYEHASDAADAAWKERSFADLVESAAPGPRSGARTRSETVRNAKPA